MGGKDKFDFLVVEIGCVLQPNIENLERGCRLDSHFEYLVIREFDLELGVPIFCDG